MLLRSHDATQSNIMYNILNFKFQLLLDLLTLHPLLFCHEFSSASDRHLALLDEITEMRP